MLLNQLRAFLFDIKTYLLKKILLQFPMIKRFCQVKTASKSVSN